MGVGDQSVSEDLAVPHPSHQLGLSGLWLPTVLLPVCLWSPRLFPLHNLSPQR